MHGIIVIILCAQALLIQTTSGQCIGAADTYGYEVSWGPAPLSNTPCAWNAYDSTPSIEWAFAPVSTLAASNGPGLTISSASSGIPAGVSVISENGYEGGLAVGGALPLLGTAAIEGALPTAGAGAVAYSCGNGAVGITTEDTGAYGFSNIAGTLGNGVGLNGHAIYGSGIGYGPCGYSLIY